MRRRQTTPPLLDVLAAAQKVAATYGQPIVIDDDRTQDARGYTLPDQLRRGYHTGRPPANKGHRYDPDPPTVPECMALLHQTRCYAPRYAALGDRMAAAIILCWQGSLRSAEALDIAIDGDLDENTGRIHVRHGKGDKARTITMAAWAWPYLAPWRVRRDAYPFGDGRLLCVAAGPTAGRRWSYSDLNRSLHRLADAAGVTRRLSPHQLRHAWAAQSYKDGVPLRSVQLHLDHSNIGTTDRYLHGMGEDVALDEVHRLDVPSIPATALLELAARHHDDPASTRELLTA